jgi:hypothetical protein
MTHLLSLILKSHPAAGPTTPTTPPSPLPPAYKYSEALRFPFVPFTT